MGMEAEWKGLDPASFSPRRNDGDDDCELVALKLFLHDQLSSRSWATLHSATANGLSSPTRRIAFYRRRNRETDEV